MSNRSSRPAADTLDDVAREKLAALQRRNLRRELVTVASAAAGRVVSAGQTLVSFSDNDYLGLAHHPDVIAASVAATQRYGTGAGAARLVTGNHPIYAALEHRLAALKGAEDAVVFGSGFLTNIGVIPALVGRQDLIVMDELCHSCLRAGATLAGGRVLEFRHNSLEHAARLLAQNRPAYRHCLLLTEGVFSMDGDCAPVAALAALAEEHAAWLMTDDAHALGVIGGGRGSSFADGVRVEVPLQMGTLSKAAGSYGGYLCASRAVCELVRNRAASFVYSTGLPPGTVAAAARALEIISSDAALVARPLALARSFTAALGLPLAESAIVPVVLGSAESALAASEALRQAGFLVTAIRPPTVPPGTARLRVTFSGVHSESDVAALASAVRPLLDRA